ncbi:hypothetical protein GCM10007872_05680 [Gluconobacter sphaericus NBRC 12467]|uniref:Uncharacterized protein n=1 Tax=Gluconobacter sphaericus NBRC 12467 TaxID=1307951 RepID=A0AA37W942_9PROT|nr:hypothetical protein GCM10007872_05680 [Gluconobacter sphaericus NBRC 12467]
MVQSSVTACPGFSKSLFCEIPTPDRLKTRHIPSPPSGVAIPTGSNLSQPKKHPIRLQNSKYKQKALSPQTRLYSRYSPRHQAAPAPRDRAYD